MAADALWEDEPANQVRQAYLKTSFVCLSRVGTELWRAAALQERVWHPWWTPVKEMGSSQMVVASFSRIMHLDTGIFFRNGLRNMIKNWRCWVGLQVPQISIQLSFYGMGWPIKKGLNLAVNLNYLPIIFYKMHTFTLICTQVHSSILSHHIQLRITRLT